MSIATALLLVGALAIMILMHSVGHGSREASHDEHGVDSVDGEAALRAYSKGEEQRQKGHGCC